MSLLPRLSPQCDEEPAHTHQDHTRLPIRRSHRAAREMKETGELPRRVKVRSSQYLNNLVEQDHRRIKQRIRPMLAFKRFEHAAVTISGIDLAEKIKKGQFKTGKLGNQKLTMSDSGTLPLPLDHCRHSGAAKLT